MAATFQSGSDYEQSSEPLVPIQVMDTDLWPVGARSGSGTKDTLANGDHPVLAIGGRTAADGRPMNLVGVMITYQAGSTAALGIATLNVANGTIVRQYVANVLTYTPGAGPLTFETAPVPGQPVYVDDSDDLAEGTTLSMSPLNDANPAVKNPLAGYLWYCQDEYADASVGGVNVASTFDGTLADSLVDQEYCVLLINAGREVS